MSCNYAEQLSPYENKGVLGAKEIFDAEDEIDKKVATLAEMFLNSKHIVVHTGAGISTSIGIPDFRGPRGVWTLEKKGEKPNVDIDFEKAIPSKTHRALKMLMDKGYIKFIISQNIDGLHMRSGIPRDNLAELHGNFFVSECSNCKVKFVRSKVVTTVGLKSAGETCPNEAKKCRGKLFDTILDWEHALPVDDMYLSIYHSTLADLNIGVGSSFQIRPSSTFPTNNSKYGGKTAILNLQVTKIEKRADLVIHAYSDVIFEKLVKRLGFEEIPEFEPEVDPTKSTKLKTWNMDVQEVNKYEQLYKNLKSANSKKQKSVQQNHKLKAKRIKSE